MTPPRYLLPAALLVLGATLLYLQAPAIANRFLLPRLLANLPFAVKELRIDQFSPFHLTGSLVLGDEQRQAVKLPRFELRFQPAALLRGRIDSLQISSAALHIELIDGQPTLPGLTTPTRQSSQKPPLAALPLAIAEIVVAESNLTVHRDNLPPLHLRLDSRLTADVVELPEGAFQLSGLDGEVTVGGQMRFTVTISTAGSSPGPLIRLQVRTADLAGSLGAWFAGHHSLPSGALQFDGWLQLDEWYRPGDFGASLESTAFAYTTGTLQWRSPAALPLRLDLAGTGSQVGWQLTNLTLVEPLPAAISLDGQFNLGDGRFSATAAISQEHLATPLAVTAHGQSGTDGTALAFQFIQNGFSPAEDLRLGRVSGEGRLDLQGDTAQGEVTLHLAEISTGMTSLVDLSLQLPLVFPLPSPADARSGRWKVAEIRHRGSHVASLAGQLNPSRDDIGLHAVLTTPLQPELRLTCQGPANWNGDLALRCQLPETALLTTDLPASLQIPAELTFSATVTADAELSVRRAIPAANLQLRVEAGELAYQGNRLSNLNCSLDLPRLPLLISAPSQLCTIGELQVGQLLFSNARILYRLEDPLALFVESARLNWCRGIVETGGLRLSPDTAEIDTTLYCDRLHFSELLKQFGMEGTEGEGSLNGRLPLVISARRVHFADGFLFSTPGDGGIVRFNNTKQLSQGMAEVAETTSFDYTMQALENFSYNWAKLFFNSFGSDLVVSMQLDGKPAVPLPYTLNNGQFVPSSKGPGLQHPVRLDVNFRLPLQELFQYGRGIHTLWENR